MIDYWSNIDDYYDMIDNWLNIDDGDDDNMWLTFDWIFMMMIKVFNWIIVMSIGDWLLF